MNSPVFRSLSASGARLRRRALDLAQKVMKGGVLHRISEVFIIRAVGGKDSAVATVIETPTFLFGGFGGMNGSSDYYTYVAAADFGPLLDAITRTTIKLEDELPTTNVPLDVFKLRLPWGDGRLSIGSLPAWGATRQALNDTTGVHTNCASAVTIAVCPSLSDEDEEPNPWVRSLFICRANGYMVASPVIYDGTEDPPIETPPDVPTGHPAVNPAVPIERPERISGIEISQGNLDLGEDDELVFAGPCVEWGPLAGMATVLVRTISIPGLVLLANELRFVRWQVTDLGEDEEPRFTPSIAWVTRFGIPQMPVADRPAAITTVAPADPAYTYPAWAIEHTAINGQEARDGRMKMRDPNLYMRIHSVKLGDEEGITDTSLALIEVQSEVEGATVSVRGYYNDGVNPVLFNTVSVLANISVKWVTYVAEITNEGVLSVVKIEEFVDSRYDTSGATTRNQVQAYGGFTTNEDVPTARLFCSEWAVPYEVLPADPDGPPPNNVQGEPSRKVLIDYFNYVRLADLDFYMLDADGNKTTLLFDIYYPLLYNINTGAAGVVPAPTNGRTGFANQSFYTTTPRYGNSTTMPICQFAPGMVAVLVALRSGYASASQFIRVAVFDVATGEMKALSPALAQLQLPATLTLTCYEQGTVVEGELTSYGTLLMSVSTALTTLGRTDGIFAITGLNKLTWVAREPSNLPAIYAGNPMAPATLGETTNISFIVPTAV